MIQRILAKKLKESLRKFPVVTITGPRQSGKTTLVKNELKGYSYFSLELPEIRSFALEDPKGFLSQFKGPVILDEVQRAPELFSYIQVLSDEKGLQGQFVLTGSHNFLLMQSISQSLAGRCAVLHLLPFSLSELSKRSPIKINSLGQVLQSLPLGSGRDIMQILFSGFYPRIHDKNVPPRDWLGSYYQTYLERDVRNVLNIGDIETFNRFVRLCAGRSGQLLNLSGLASDCGVTHTTAKRWLSILEASFIIFLLRPHYNNFGKRLIKNPKLYFFDSGLLCFLLRIQTPDDLYNHSARGSIFEGFVLSELYKNFVNRGEEAPLYFWRDSAGHEIDVVIDMGDRLLPIEIKSAQTVASDFFDELKYWKKLSGNINELASLIYGGDRHFKQAGVTVYPWFVL